MKKTLLIFAVLLSSLMLSAQVYTLTTDTIEISEITVSGNYNATRTTPFTFQNLAKTEIELRSLNSEPAVLISNTPSVSFYSDNGTGLGYIYYRIRGIDQTKINATFNGVPLNEPEDQGIYFNNFPGFLNSVSNVQVIRGVGISKPGISSYGGSINFSPLEFSNKFSGNTSISFGSYNTFLLSAGINTPDFFLNASYNTTDGYKEDVFNKSWSAFYGLKQVYGEHELKLYGFIGKQSNGMGWIGESLDSINVNPRINTNTADEQDQFSEVHQQLVWNWKNLMTTIYYTYLEGGYGINGIRYGYEGIDTTSVESNWVGANVNYKANLGNNFCLNVGTNAYMYNRKHFGDQSSWYTNTGYKNSVSPYAKAELKINKVDFYGDIQYRYATFTYVGDSIFPKQTYNFLDWSAGITYELNKNTRLYYGIGKTHKEPKRYDYFGGIEDYSPSYYTALVPEELLDNEIGIKYNNGSFIANANFYYMSFKNEMSLTGNLGYNALSLSNINIDKSYRTGLEIDAKYRWHNGFEIGTISAFSYNEIQEGTYIGKPVLTPSVIASLDGSYHLKFGYIGTNIKYTSESFIDFENQNILPSYNTLNLYAGVIWKAFELKGSLNNITNQLILGSAYMNWDDTPRYFVMAGINGLLTLKYSF